MSVYDVAIVGAGIAGASIAAMLAPHARVLLLEAESQPGYHATGRSAAFWSETYGGPGVQPLTTASGPWLRQPPQAFGGEGFLGPRGQLFIAREDDAAVLDAFEADFAGSGVVLERVSPGEMVPGLRPEWALGLLQPDCCDIDVGRLHGAYLKAARSGGVTLMCDAPLVAARREGDGWLLETRAGSFAAGVLVNAAGAWADGVAEMAGAAPVGIRPYRRTMVQLRTDPVPSPSLPVVTDARWRFYFRPEAGGKLWLTPHDEIPDQPGDVAPEEIDVAVAIDRLERAVDWRVAAVERRWAGLRSFAPDRLPVYGYDAQVPGFFWFAGQGGFGIQTSPAAAMLGAALLLGQPRDPMVAGIDAAAYAPDRPALSRP